jgi:hypothetical protein
MLAYKRSGIKFSFGDEKSLINFFFGENVIILLIYCQESEKVKVFLPD